MNTNIIITSACITAFIILGCSTKNSDSNEIQSPDGVVKFDGIGIWPHVKNSNVVSGEVTLDPLFNGMTLATIYLELNGTAYSASETVKVTGGKLKYIAKNLPQGNYHLRVWVDGNSNGIGGNFSGSEIGDYYSHWGGYGTVTKIADGPGEWYLQVMDGMTPKTANITIVMIAPAGAG